MKFVEAAGAYHREGRYFALDTMAFGDIAYNDRAVCLPEPEPLSAVQNYAEPYGPLTAAMFHVLLALAGDDLHGYAILKEVELRSRPADSDDERRRYYRLTPQGRQVAAGEAERMDEVLSIARSRNLLKKARTA